jgi:hypothetical protein
VIFLLLAGIVLGMYFTNPGHFFQADTVFWFDHRLHSFGEFLQSFGSLDPGGWYRPLTNPTIESLFFPIFGFNPTPYRVIIFGLFFLDVLLVWALVRRVTGSKFAAGFAAVFFSSHTVNAYITYDVAFTPELGLLGLYVATVLFFLTYLQTGSRSAYAASLITQVLCFFCKEPSVTLPFMLLTAQMILERKWKPSTWRNVLPHFALLAIYLVFVLGRLGVARQAFDPKAIAFVYGGSAITDNLHSGVLWAMNLPRGVHTQFRHLSVDRYRFFAGFAALTALLMLCAIRLKGRYLAFGLAWFCITVAPMLPLEGHFLPYYLFLPLAGLSVAIGAAFDYGHAQLAKLHRGAANAVALVIAGALVAVCAVTVRYDVNDNYLMGDSARISSNSLADMRRMYPQLPPAAVIYIDDSKEPVWWNHASGGLFRLAYGDDSLQALYASLGDKKPPNDRLILLRHTSGGRLAPDD